MTIGKRLQQVMGMVKAGVTIPVIIEVAHIDSNVESILRSNGFRITTTSRIVPLIYGTADSGIINKISTLDFVLTISYDEPTAIQSFPIAMKMDQRTEIPISQVVDAIGAREVWDAGYTGTGVKIGIIDTGASVKHEMLKDAIAGVYSAVPGEDVTDNNSHGSWCASAAAGRPVDVGGVTLYGVVPGAELYILKALSNEGIGQMSWVNDCMEKAVLDFGCDIISMSLGSLVDMGGTDPTSKLVNEITNKYNVLFVIAAGNSFGIMTIGSPGGAVGAITVGSVALNLPGFDVVSTFSSKGPTTAMLIKPEISSYGGNVIAEGISELIFAAAAHGGYTAMAGTSMACPQVAGAMALLRQAKPDLSRNEVEAIFAEVGFPHPKDNLTGYGVIRVDRMLERLFAQHGPLLQIGKVLEFSQSLMTYPMTLLPRDDAEHDQLNVVRLPVIQRSRG